MTAVIGNSSSAYAGRMSIGGSPKIEVLADALAFNSFMGPNVPLYSLGELDAASTKPSYEQFFMRLWSYDTVGFRFDVDDVFKRLVAAVQANVPANMLGGDTPDQWVRDSHPCVKVRIMSGERPDDYTPWGAVTAIDASPLKDRHIAQRNLAHFDMTQMAMKPADVEEFIVAQAGAGVNGLSLRHMLPLDAFRIYLAIPRAAYERYIDPKTSKGGAVRGFEEINATGREGPTKPFPGEAVLLRQTNAAAEIHVADHAKRCKFFGMALGLEGDPARLKGIVRVTDIRWPMPTSRPTAWWAASRCSSTGGGRRAGERSAAELVEGRAAVERRREAEIAGVVLLDLALDAAPVERGVLGVLGIEADIGPHGLDEAGILAGVGVGRLERVHGLGEVEQQDIVRGTAAARRRRAGSS